MLMLSVLHDLLSQVLSPPNLHTALLFTPSGELVSVANKPTRSKDEVRILVGLGVEIWQETREEGFGMVDSELGRIIVLPVEEPASANSENHFEARQPLMLLALNATESVEWEELDNKGRALSEHLARPLSRFRELIAPPNFDVLSPGVIQV